MKIEIQNFLSMEYNNIVIAEPIGARPTMAIERLHLGTTISIERQHSAITMFHWPLTLYLVLNDFAISFLDIISIFCKDQ